ncbi:MAG TPA: hypothetical protein VN132_13355, partial [Bdellovibrio sp.]|nr:hypothetical protein [Bdellovibrio sp.]
MKALITSLFLMVSSIVFADDCFQTIYRIPGVKDQFAVQKACEGHTTEDQVRLLESCFKNLFLIPGIHERAVAISCR